MLRENLADYPILHMLDFLGAHNTVAKKIYFSFKANTLLLKVFLLKDIADQIIKNTEM